MVINFCDRCQESIPEAAPGFPLSDGTTICSRCFETLQRSHAERRRSNARARSRAPAEARRRGSGKSDQNKLALVLLIVAAVIILGIIVGPQGAPSWTGEISEASYDYDRWIVPSGKPESEIEAAGKAKWKDLWNEGTSAGQKGPKIMFFYDDPTLARCKTGPWIVRLMHPGPDYSKFAEPKLTWRSFPRPFTSQEWVLFEEFCDFEDAHPETGSWSAEARVEAFCKTTNRVARVLSPKIKTMFDWLIDYDS